MNRRHPSIVVFMSICVVVAPGRVYACECLPISQIVAHDQNICVGDYASFNGMTYFNPTYHGSYEPDNNPDPIGGGVGIAQADWYFGEGDWAINVGLITCHQYNTPGKYQVWLDVMDDEGDWPDIADIDSCWVYVAAVEKVVQLGTEDEGPIYVCACSTAVVYLGAVCPVDGVPFPEGFPVWTIEEQPTGGNALLIPAGGGSAVLTDLAVPGHYKVKARAGTSSDTITVTAFEIRSRTKATVPEPRNRTTIAIAEQVDCWTYPTVSVNWSLDTPGLGNLSPEQGPGTVFTAGRYCHYPTLHAQVGSADCTLPFAVIIPTGETVHFRENELYEGLNEDPEGDKIGEGTAIFTCTMLPLTVNFHRAWFRENIPEATWTWPDGTPETLTARYCRFQTWTVDGVHNSATDYCQDGPKPRSYLDNGSGYSDHEHSILVPIEYQQESGDYALLFEEDRHDYQYRGSDCKGRVFFQCNDDQTDNYSPWKGPWIDE